MVRLSRTRTSARYWLEAGFEEIEVRIAPRIARIASNRTGPCHRTPGKQDQLAEAFQVACHPTTNRGLTLPKLANPLDFRFFASY
jgi:hypothetical protein